MKTKLHLFTLIHAEHANRGPSNGGAPYNPGAVKAKVLRPGVFPRVEESYHRVGERVDAAQVTGFVKVAVIAGVC